MPPHAWGGAGQPSAAVQARAADAGPGAARDQDANEFANNATAADLQGVGVAAAPPPPSEGGPAASGSNDGAAPCYGAGAVLALAGAGAAPIVQRKCACGATASGGSNEDCDECQKKTVMRREATGTSPAASSEAAPSSPTIAVPVSAPGDPLELEADRMAEHALRAMPPGAVSRGGEVPLQVQRAAAVGAAPDNSGAGGLIVDDDAQTLTSGQMRKTPFLAVLRGEVCAAADRALTRAGRDTRGCPYIEKWLGTYAERPAAHLERALRKLAPGVGGARSAHDYISPVAARIERGVNKWVDTGRVPDDIPDELRTALPGGGGIADAGIGDAVAGAVSSVAGAIGGAFSAIGHLFFKDAPGGGRPGADAAAVSARIGPGRPIDAAVRGRMESAFGYGFDAVRIHDDQTAAELSRDLNARAFTMGSHVAFAASEYRPGSLVGDALLAHELAHVIQQGGARARMDPAGAVTEEGATLEADADLAAAGAVARLWRGGDGRVEPAGPADRRSLRPAGGLRLQRCASTPAITYQDCSDTDQAMLAGDTARALGWIQAALSVVKAAQSGLSQGASGVPDPVKGRIKADFRLDLARPDAGSLLADIVTTFQEMAEGASGRLQFECHPNESRSIHSSASAEDAAAVEPALPFKFFSRRSDVQVFKPYLTDKDEWFRTYVLVHELAHKYSARDDNGQLCGPPYTSGLDAAHAIDNADSYAAFAFHTILGANPNMDTSKIDVCKEKTEVSSSGGGVMRKADDGAEGGHGGHGGHGGARAAGDAGGGGGSASAPGDPCEIEADQMADRALRALPPGAPAVSSSRPAQVQRAAATAAVSASPDAAPGAAGSGGLIVEDETQALTGGQARKTPFLDALRPAVCAAADRALARAGRDSKGCPYVEKWLATYAGRPARHLERALHKFVPGSRVVASAGEYIPLVAARIERGVEVWVETGRIPDDIPDELRAALPGGGADAGGAVGAIGGALSSVADAIGGALSSIGHLFFKKGAIGGGARPAAPAADAGALSARLGAGRSLDNDVRARMEGAFGRSFAEVRVHDDSAAAALSRDLDARAFTLGAHVAFADGGYRPGTPVGDALLAHELAHVVQQQPAAPSASTGAPTAPALASAPAAAAAVPSAPELEAEADEAAAAAVGQIWGGSGAAKLHLKAAQPRSRPGLRLQRCGAGATEAKAPASNDGVCVADQPAKVEGARAAAKTVLGKAITALSATPWSAETRAAVECYFPSATAAALVGPFGKAAGFISDIRFICPHIPFKEFGATDQLTKKRTVYKAEPGLFALSLLEEGPDHGPPPAKAQRQTLLFPEFFDDTTSDGERARAEIHEAFHHALFGGFSVEESDPAAAYEPSCAKLPLQKALDNADSYAQLALRLARNTK